MHEIMEEFERWKSAANADDVPPQYPREMAPWILTAKHVEALKRRKFRFAFRIDKQKKSEFFLRVLMQEN